MKSLSTLSFPVIRGVQAGTRILRDDVDVADAEANFHFRRAGTAAGTSGAAHPEQGADAGDRRLHSR